MVSALRHPRAVVRGLLLAASLVALAWAGKWLAGAGILSERWIDAEIAGHGWSGYLLFLGIGALATALGFPRQVVSFLGGYAFGAITGIVLALLATAAGCIATFAYARVFARAAVSRALRDRARRFEDFLSVAPFQMTLIVRLLPVGNNLLTNLLAGITRVRLAPFVAGSAIGYIPQTAAFGLAGSGIHVAPIVNAVLAGVLLVASGLIGVGLYRSHRRGAALEQSIDAALDTGDASRGPAL